MRRPQELFVFVRRGDQYLVLHRAPPGGSYWHGLAGALEPGENYSEAARGELALARKALSLLCWPEPRAILESLA